LSVYLGATWQSGQAAWSSLTTLSYGWNTIDLTVPSTIVFAGGEFTIGIQALRLMVGQRPPQSRARG
jgi:hypothetical protein